MLVPEVLISAHPKSFADPLGSLFYISLKCSSCVSTARRRDDDDTWASHSQYDYCGLTRLFTRTSLRYQNAQKGRGRNIAAIPGLIRLVTGRSLGMDKFTKDYVHVVVPDSLMKSPGYNRPSHHGTCREDLVKRIGASETTMRPEYVRVFCLAFFDNT